MTPWLFLIAVVALLLWLVYRRHVFTSAFRFPGPRAFPLIGNCNLLTGSQTDFFRLCYRLGKEHTGGVFQLWVGMRPFVFLYNSQLVKPLVTSSSHLAKNFEYSLTEDWLGKGLITVNNGELWQKQRKILTSCFHFNILKELSVPVWKHSQVLLGKLRESAHPVDIVPLAKLLALDIICESAMGIDIGTQKNCDSKYPVAITRMVNILSYRFITPWMKPKIIFDLTPSGKEYNKLVSKVQGFVKKIILQKKHDRALHNRCVSGFETATNVSSGEILNLETEGKGSHAVEMCKDCSQPACKGDVKPRKQMALLDCLLKLSEEDTSITDKEITDQVNTFMFAGHDTISTAISFILFALGHHPEWQDAIVDEVDILCPDILTVEPQSRLFLKGLPLMDRCIKEAMRLYPPSPLVGRTINTPLDTPGGTLPAGTTAVVYTFLLHRDPNVFKDPDCFDPDRFLPENCPEDPFAFIPFSAGQRNCIGKSLAMLELKISLAMILKSFRVKSLQNEDELDLSFEIVLKNNKGIYLQFSPRN